MSEKKKTTAKKTAVKNKETVKKAVPKKVPAALVDTTDAISLPKMMPKKKNKKGTKSKIVMLLPSYNPDEKLVNTVYDLIDAGFEDIVVVDDGGNEECQKYFDMIADDVHLVRHAVNQGKGRALKTGLNYAKWTFKDDLMGVIAADGDGQHQITAILDCKDAMEKNPDKLILGVRQFAKGNVPLANLTGNLITVGVFYGLTQTYFSDTQCGLRGFPANIIDDMIETSGERFEYENNMLIDVRKKGINFVEVPMDAVYIEDNQTSHFNKVTDSIIIYRNILKFALLPVIVGLIGFFFSYLFFNNGGCVTGMRAASTYAAGAILSWFILSFTFKNESWINTLLVFLWTAISTGLFYFMWRLLNMNNYAGAWWLAAIVVVPVSYGLYLRVRYGKRPKKTKYSNDK